MCVIKITKILIIVSSYATLRQSCSQNAAHMLSEQNRICPGQTALNLLKSTGYVMNQQFNIQQLYPLPTLCLRVLFLSDDKRRFVPLTA
jgi:hypothetical protein